MLQEKIKADLKEAILKKDDDRKAIIRVMLGELNRVDKQVDDDKVVSILKKMYQNAIDANNDTEASIINEYLPKMLSESEIKDAIDKIVSDNNYFTKKDMGSVMKEIKVNYGSTVDGKVASMYLKEKLV